MKFFLHIIVCFLTIAAHAQDEDTLVHWSDSRKLKFSDFRALAQPNRGALAGLSVHQFLVSEKSADVFIVQNVFLTNRSWITSKISVIIEHEQLHFDIGELFARMLRGCIEKLGNSDTCRISLQMKIDQKHNSYNNLPEGRIDINSSKGMLLRMKTSLLGKFGRRPDEFYKG